MRAVEYTRYGPPEVLRIVEVEKPTPKNHEVLIRVDATTVTSTDCIFRRGDSFFARLFTGLLKPKQNRPGDVLAGEVVAVGKEISRFKVGDPVFGTCHAGFGAHAEYVCLPEDGTLAIRPSNRTCGEAAAVCDGALTALPFLRDKGKIERGQKVLINGASGSIGTFAVQIAKHFGAEVTGVCSTANVELVKTLGADQVIDYTQVTYTKSGQTYDIIFDTVGKILFSQCKGSLKPNGRFLEAAFTPAIFPQVLWNSKFGNKKALVAATGLRPPSERTKDLQFLKDLVEAGKLESVIDRSYPLARIAEAHRYVDTGHKKGSVVITLGKNDSE